MIADASSDRGMPAPYVHHKNGPGYIYTSYVFDTLIDHGANGDLTPGLAESWTLSDDGLVADLTLNDKARWHDGTPVTAEDVAFTFAYMTDHPYVLTSVAMVDTVEAISKDHARITLKRPYAGLQSGPLLSLPILPKHIYQDQPAPERFVDRKAATGSGPYKLVSYDKAQGRYLFERNDGYYRGTPKFRQVAIVKMAPDAALQAMAAGEVDVIGSLPWTKVEAAKKAGLNVLSARSNHPVRLVFNHQGMFREKDLRHALAFAIDRQALIDVVYQDGAVVAETGYFQMGSPWRRETADPDYAHDADKAAALFRQNGWERGDDGRWHRDGSPVVLRLIADKSFNNLATALADQLEAFGISVDLRILERAAQQEHVRTGDFDLALFTASTMGDPNGVARRVTSPMFWRGDRFQDSEAMKAAIRAQAGALDHAERLDQLHRFQALYAEELPAYMLVNPIWTTVHSDKVTPRYLGDGVAFGIPSALHKSMFLR
ncbi:peptide/nickel transport system substrate-binding protein [Rhodobium orientis]|uniref:ABC transporter substrate-binding protein n=1 Tax=Rhodobium orientis TaxID=34017 RepID=UPI00184845E8|nr:peptide/nickel transport system substrate-binding protein [Rhodobium orientis]